MLAVGRVAVVHHERASNAEQGQRISEIADRALVGMVRVDQHDVERPALRPNPRHAFAGVFAGRAEVDRMPVVVVRRTAVDEPLADFVAGRPCRLEPVAGGAGRDLEIPPVAVVPGKSLDDVRFADERHNLAL